MPTNVIILGYDEIPTELIAEKLDEVLNGKRGITERILGLGSRKKEKEYNVSLQLYNSSQSTEEIFRILMEGNPDVIAADPSDTAYDFEKKDWSNEKYPALLDELSTCDIPTIIYLTTERREDAYQQAIVKPIIERDIPFAGKFRSYKLADTIADIIRERVAKPEQE